MGSRVFVATVMLLWGTSLAWLGSRIVSPLFRGEPPSVGVLAKRQPVAWNIGLAGQWCGTAITESVDGDLGTTEILSRVQLEDLPVSQVAPQWMSSLVRSIGRVKLDMRSRTTVDSLGRLVRFDTSVKVNEVPAMIRMTGRVLDDKLDLRITTGDFARSLQYPWTSSEPLTGELTPDAKMLQIYKGRTWRKEVYSPFGLPHNPVELLEAEVVSAERIHFEGALVNCHRIEYRAVTAVGVSAGDRLRATVWVAEDGRVLRQQSHIMNSELRFDRLSDKAALTLARDQLELNLRATLP
jgi:hypothetical protein